ncbi:IS200/IS605 family transposase [Reichenbachiella sp. MALMAid0571]|uniref:IS200/IS605 family transposase n=1 Tax=Reichenbachiella sp. MALMAid0571 TaxID=3143939 RepID=UPI0032E0018C
MSNFKKLSHVLYRCDYHIVWTPKYRFKVLSGLVKQLLDHDIVMLLEWQGCEKKELNIQIDHIHLVVSVPPKVSISKLMGILKGKTAIKIFKSYPQLKQKPYWGNHFWSRGYCVDTIGLDEEKIRKYVQYQEKQEKVEEQQKLDFGPL